MHGNVNAFGNWRWALGSDDFSDIHAFTRKPENINKTRVLLMLLVLIKRWFFRYPYVFTKKPENINKTRVLLMLLVLLIIWNLKKCLKLGFC